MSHGKELIIGPECGWRIGLRQTWCFSSCLLDLIQLIDAEILELLCFSAGPGNSELLDGFVLPRTKVDQQIIRGHITLA